MTVSDKPWSQFKDSDYSDEQYARACLLDRGPSAGSAKQRYSIPVREPDGTLNRNGCHAAAAVLSSTGGAGSARGNKMKATPEQISSARSKLASLYKNALGEEVPDGLKHSQIEIGQAAVEEILRHHGVLGMKWGVRKDRVSGAVRKAAKGAVAVGRELHKTSQDVQFEIGRHEAHHAIVDKASTKLIKSLPALKEKHGQGGKLTHRIRHPMSPEAKAYRADVKNTYLRHLESSANEMRSGSGRLQYTLKERGKPNTSKYFWNVHTQPVAAHAATGSSSTHVATVHPVCDSDGYITGVSRVSNEMGHSSIGAEFVEQYFAVS